VTRTLAAAAVIVLLVAGCGGKKGATIEPGKSYSAVVETTKGSFTIELAPEESPNATQSFVKLADKGFYDGTIFHRIIPGFVIQGGDPTGTGTGGPGYVTHDQVAPATLYAHGTVAMAKTAAEPPGTAGSQFFVVTAPNANLPPEYAVIGDISDGLDVVDAIGKLGRANGKPTERVEIKHITIKAE
jgi:peptidyl-prolyl cis-trans isomerase B (cyclophilin B)